MSDDEPAHPAGAPSIGELWLLDANVLVALTLSTHLHHRAAHAALRAHDGHWATTPITEAALLRLLLNPRVTGRSFRPHDVMATVAGLRNDPRWRWINDNSSLADPAIETSVLVGHQQVTDLHLVNLAARTASLLTTFDAGIAKALAPRDRRHVKLLQQ